MTLNLKNLPAPYALYAIIVILVLLIALLLHICLLFSASLYDNVLVSNGKSDQKYHSNACQNFETIGRNFVRNSVILSERCVAYVFCPKLLNDEVSHVNVSHSLTKQFIHQTICPSRDVTTG